MKPKPCPFCGKEPIVKPFDPEIEGTAWGAVECIYGRCPANPMVFDGAKIADDRGPNKYKQAAIRRWNRRSTL